MVNDTAIREQQLVTREKAVARREKDFAEKDRGFDAKLRLVMAASAQVLGFFLLFILGMGIDWPIGTPEITRGYSFILRIAWIYLTVTIAFPAIVLVISLWQRKIKDGHTDIIMLGFVGVDLLLLLLLVKQEGGLCRSMFLPVFFLIPTAYLIVERRENRYRWRRLLVLLAIVGCICSSYRISKQHRPPENSANLHVAGSVLIFWHPKQITDFEALAHRQYDDAIFAASLVSAFIPIFQIIVLMARDRLRDDHLEESLS